LSGPTQPHDFLFPCKWIGGEWRSFQKTWFDEFDWLEYSEPTYCLYCYLFFNSASLKNLGVLSLPHQGYVNWKKAKDIFNNQSVCKTHVEDRLKSKGQI